MKVIIAPDSFKECLSSPQVAAAMADGARARWPEAEVVELPLADGGEGTLEVLSSALGARPMKADVHDPWADALRHAMPARGALLSLKWLRLWGFRF